MKANNHYVVLRIWLLCHVGGNTQNTNIHLAALNIHCSQVEIPTKKVQICRGDPRGRPYSQQIPTSKVEIATKISKEFYEVF